MTVLVVDDDISLAELLQDQLEAEGQSCLTARDVEEAEWTMQNVDIDAMAVDLETPGRNTLEWLLELSLARPDLTRSCILVVGRELEAEELARVRAVGASVLKKPFPIQDLHEAIVAHLRLKESRASRPDIPRIERDSGREDVKRES